MDVEKAFDTVPRELALVFVKWAGFGEAEARMVEAMYKEPTTAL